MWMIVLMPVAMLELEAQRFAGRPVAVDARLALADCPAPRMALEGQGVEVRCDVPAWRVWLPFEVPETPAPAALPAIAAQPALPAIAAVRDDGRSPARGLPVDLVISGPGFEVRAATLSDGPAGGGLTWLKTAAGRRLKARIGEDGRARLTGLKPGINRR